MANTFRYRSDRVERSRRRLNQNPKHQYHRNDKHNKTMEDYLDAFESLTKFEDEFEENI